MIPVRYRQLWNLVKQHVGTSSLLSILVVGKVYLEGEDYSQPEGAEGGQWGRVVLVPTSSPFPAAPTNEELLSLGMLVRSEVSNFQNVNYMPQVALEAQQWELYTQLQGWLPPATTFLKPASAFRLVRPWQELPMWDQVRGLYFISSVYQIMVTHVGQGPVGVTGVAGGTFVGG